MDRQTRQEGDIITTITRQDPITILSDNLFKKESNSLINRSILQLRYMNQFYRLKKHNLTRFLRVEAPLN